jgi:radical SAM protein with 4Fe4S-binding SPASM domain
MILWRPAVDSKNWRQSYLLLSHQAAIKYLEQPFLYHITNDELYEIDDRAVEFLKCCDGTKKGCDLTDDEEFVEYCLEEGLLLSLSEPLQSDISVDVAPYPSLRYLELQLTQCCNLNCRHCYLGNAGKEILGIDDAITIAKEFASMGGLRLMLSGGEPVLYPYLKTFLQKISDLKVRRILLTNGTLITPKNVEELMVDEIQFSLDGWCKGHEMLRGSGTFDQVMEGIKAAKNAGIQVSVATMIHKGNLEEFEQLSNFVEDTGVCEWGVDMLCMAGNLKKHRDILVLPENAVTYLKYAFGGGYHGNSEGFACGRHLMTVLPSGMGVKCGFYDNQPLSDARQSLRESWLKLEHIPLDDLRCKGCPSIEDCAGGCRFRAPDPLAPDPVMCALYGIDKG